MKKLINISIDDVSPHPKSSIKVLDRCFELIKDFNDIKFSLFVPVSYWRTIKYGTATKFPLQIDHHKDFCEALKTLPEKNFEICIHGFHHGIPGVSDNDEFQRLSYNESIERFSGIEKVIKMAGLENVFKKIFRPPAWRMSPDAIRAARDSGIKVLALSPKEYAKKIYGGEEEKKKDVVYYNSNPPFDKLEMFEKTEIVYHACEWDRNYLSNELTEDLREFLNAHDDYDFCFLEDML